MTGAHGESRSRTRARKPICPEKHTSGDDLRGLHKVPAARGSCLSMPINWPPFLTAQLKLRRLRLPLKGPRSTSILPASLRPSMASPGGPQLQVGALVNPNSGPVTSESTLDPIKVYFTVSEREYLDWNKRFPTESKWKFRIEPNYELGRCKISPRRESRVSILGACSLPRQCIHPCLGDSNLYNIFGRRPSTGMDG